MSSKRRDSELRARIEDLADTAYTKREADSDRNLINHVHKAMENKIEKNAQNDIRQWTSIRDHISIPAHKGAEFQLENIQDRFGLKLFRGEWQKGDGK